MHLIRQAAAAKRTIPVGVVLSQDGSYAVTTRAMIEGIKVAQQQVAARADLDVELELVLMNPAGILSNYPRMCEELIARGIRHVIGCNTSASRKAVIPLFERHGALLWYTARYEGFETSSNIVYLGATPNQHIVPLVDYLVSCGYRRAFSIGSDYIWSWENDRIMHETLLPSGGTLVGQSLIEVGRFCTDETIQEIIAHKPDFVFNNLIGMSSYNFFHRFRAACRARGIDQARSMPIVSCGMSEPELVEIGRGFCEGHIVSSPYFTTIDSAQNRAFIQSFERLAGSQAAVSSDAESAYQATIALAQALAACQTDDVSDVLAALRPMRLDSPQGTIWFDPETMHLHLWPRIGRSTGEANFEIVWESNQPVAPDPYLTRTMAETELMPFEPVRLVV